MVAKVPEKCPGPGCSAALDPSNRHCDSPTCPWTRCPSCQVSVNRAGNYHPRKAAQ